MTCPSLLRSYYITEGGGGVLYLEKLRGFALHKNFFDPVLEEISVDMKSILRIEREKAKTERERETSALIPRGVHGGNLRQPHEKDK